MNKIPFTVYDFFAYLSSGSVLVAVCDLLHGKRWLESTPTLHQNLLLILLAYVVGHAVAQLSSLILEKGLVKALKFPSHTLLNEATGAQAWVKHVFRLYYRELPAETKQRIATQAKARGFVGAGEALFLHAYGLVRQNKDLAPQIEQFMNLYGFARNTTLSLLVAAVLIWVGPSEQGLMIPTSWGWLAAGLALVMLYRYLKFFRQYTYELFVTYAELGAS